jgi:hypothetical protein
VLELHPDAAYFHVGGDETAFLGRCQACVTRSRRVGPLGIYVEHLRRVCEWVAARGLRPILWDDILRKNPQSAATLPKSAVLMYWDYGAVGTPVDRRKSRQAVAAGTADLLAGRALDPPPYLRYRDAGHALMLAPCYSDGGLVPLGNAANCRHLAQEAALHGCLGLCATHWAVFRTPPDCAAYGAAAAADAAWNPLPSRDDALTTHLAGAAVEFDRRFCRAYFDLPDDTLIQALRLLGPGPLYIPSDGRGYPTAYAEACFVDMSFGVERETMLACMAAFFRPDWKTPVSGFSWEQAWRHKVAALKREPAQPTVRAVVSDLARAQERGLALLREERCRARRHLELLAGLEAGARLRALRTRLLLHELGAGPRPAAAPDLNAELVAHYGRYVSEEDARQIVAWQSVGLKGVRSRCGCGTKNRGIELPGRRGKRLGPG